MFGNVIGKKTLTYANMENFSTAKKLVHSLRGVDLFYHKARNIPTLLEMHNITGRLRYVKRETTNK